MPPVPGGDGGVDSQYSRLLTELLQQNTDFWGARHAIPAAQCSSPHAARVVTAERLGELAATGLVRDRRRHRRRRGVRRAAEDGAAAPQRRAEERGVPAGEQQRPQRPGGVVARASRAGQTRSRRSCRCFAACRWWWSGVIRAGRWRGPPPPPPPRCTTTAARVRARRRTTTSTSTAATPPRTLAVSRR